MYSISPQLANNYSSTLDLNSLIDKVDTRIMQIAIVHYNNVRLGLKQYLDLEKYEDLLIYRDILLDKLLGCNCLDKQFLLPIVSKLNKLIK